MNLGSVVKNKVGECMALLSVCENRSNLVSMKFSLRREAQVLKAPTGVMKGQSVSEKKAVAFFSLTVGVGDSLWFISVKEV